MSRADAIKEYGCPKSSLSEELLKRGITEPDPKKVAVKNAIVSAVNSVSELSEQITELEQNAILAVAANEAAHKISLFNVMQEATNIAVEIMREKREMGELSIMETKQVVEMAAKHVESRYGKVTPDNQNNIAVQVNGMPAMMPTVIEIVAPE
jgi:ribosomal protein L7/L12